jgi:hypothetical protein
MNQRWLRRQILAVRRFADQKKGVGHGTTRRTLLAATRAYLVDAVAVLAGLVALLSILAVTFVFVWELFQKRVILDSLSVPERLAKRGLTGEVIALRVSDRVKQIQHLAGSTVDKLAFASGSAEAELVITSPAGEFSLRSVVAHFRSAICDAIEIACPAALRISGEIVETPQGYVARLRRQGGPPIAAVQYGVDPLRLDIGPYAENQLEELTAASARAIIWALEPFVLASYTRNVDKDTERAAAMATWIAGTYPRDTESWVRATVLLGVIAEPRDKSAAELYYRRALAVKPTSTVAWNNLGNLYLDKGKHEEALRAFTSAFDIDPNRYHTNINLATAYLKYPNGGKEAQALKHLELAVTLNSSPKKALCMLCNITWKSLPKHRKDFYCDWLEEVEAAANVHVHTEVCQPLP